MVSDKKKMAHFILVQNIYIISQFIVVQNIESQLHYILMYSQFHYFLSQFIFVQNIKSQYHYILSQFILVKNIESQLHYFLSQSCSKYWMIISLFLFKLFISSQNLFLFKILNDNFDLVQYFQEKGKYLNRNFTLYIFHIGLWPTNSSSDNKKQHQ